MRRTLTALVFGLVAGFAASAIAGHTITHEVLVLTTVTKVPRTSYWSGFELYNHGPNSIFCALGANEDGGAPIYPDGGLSLAVDMARPILAESSWSASEPLGEQIWCIAKTASQVSGAATILTESP